MNRRWTVVGLVIVLAMVVGGGLAVVPLGLAMRDLSGPPERAPSAPLEESRRAVTGRMATVLSDVSRRAEALEALGGLLAEGIRPPERPQAISVAPKP